MCNKGPPFNADKMEELYEKVQMGIFERVSPIYTDELNQILDIPSVKNQCRDLDMNEIMPPQDGLLNTIKLTPNLLDLNNVLPQPKYESSQIKVRSRSVQTHRPTAFQDEAQIKGVPIRLRDRHIAPKEQDLLQAYKKADSSVGGLASPIPSSRYQAIPPREYMAPLGSRVQGTAAPHSATSKPAHMLQPYIQQPVAQPIGLASKPQLDKPPSARPGVAGYDGVLGSARPALQLANMGLRDSAKATELPLPRGGSVPIANKQVSNAPSTIVNEPKPSPQPSPAIPSQPQASQASQPLQSQRNNLSRNSARLGKEETEEAASSRRDQRMVVKQPPSYLQDLLMGGLEPRKQVGVLGVLPKSAAAPSNIHSRIGDSRVGPTLQLRQSGSRSPPQNQSESRLLNKSLARRDGSVNESLNQVVPPKPKEPGSPGIFVLNKLNIGNAALHSRFQSKLDRYAERQRSSDQSKAKEASQVLAGDSRLQLSPKAKDSSISYKNRLLGPQQQSQNGSLLRESMKRQTDEQAIQRSSAQTGQGIDLPTRTRPTDPGSILHPSFLAGIHMPTEPVARVKSVQQYEEELAKKVEEEIVKRQRKRVLLNAQSAHERYDTDGGLVNGAAIASKLLSENLSSYRSAAEPQRQRPEIESHRVLSSATKDVSTALAAQAHALASVKAATLKKHPKVISPMMGQRIGLVNQSQKTEEEVTIKRSGIQRLVPTQASANAGSNKLSLASHLVPSLDRHPTAVQPQRVNSAFHLNKKISEGNIRSPIVNNFLAKSSLASEIGVPFPKYSNRQLSEREAEELEKFNKKIDMLHVKRSQGEKSTPQMAAGIVAHYRKKPLASASKVK